MIEVQKWKQMLQPHPPPVKDSNPGAESCLAIFLLLLSLKSIMAVKRRG